MSAHDWKFYLSSSDAWDGMIGACERAQSSIDCEQFIFHNDAVGERFAKVFVAKAKEGVRVRLLCDMAGSFFFSSSSLVRELRAAGVEVRFFNPISAWKVITLEPWVFRDHRKLLVVDRHAGFVGSVGIDESFAKWRDTHVRIIGEVVHDLQEAFDHMWWVTERGRFGRFKEHKQNGDGFTVITNAPHFRRRFINRTFLDAIRHARKYVYITTPYFVPDRKFFRVLRLAARRGVDVRVLVPEKSDHPYVDLAGRAHFRKAFKAGIKIYEYRAAVLHAKTMVIDGDWSSVGSSNIDNLSSFANYELNLASIEKRFAEELRNQFLADIASSSQIDPVTWKDRPLLLKLLEMLCLPFGRFF